MSAEEVDNETFHGAAEWNASFAYSPGLLLYPHSGGVSLSIVHLDVLKGYALKLLEAARKAKKYFNAFFAVFFFICSKIWTEENHYWVYICCFYFCTSVWFSVCLLQTKFIFQKTKLQENLYACPWSSQKNSLESLISSFDDEDAVDTGIGVEFGPSEYFFQCYWLDIV